MVLLGKFFVGTLRGPPASKIVGVTTIEANDIFMSISTLCINKRFESRLIDLHRDVGYRLPRETMRLTREVLEIGSLSRSATTETRMYARNQTQKNRGNVETQDITWKTHYGGKNHDSPQAVKYTI